MNKLALALLVTLLCAGCASRYDITLSNGEIITSKGKPHLNSDKTAWIYITASGRTNALPAGNVTEVSPQSMTSANPTQFSPNNSVTTTTYAPKK
jgi:hypothetical protein